MTIQYHYSENLMFAKKTKGNKYNFLVYFYLPLSNLYSIFFIIYTLLEYTHLALTLHIFFLASHTVPQGRQREVGNLVLRARPFHENFYFRLTHKLKKIIIINLYKKWVGTTLITKARVRQKRRSSRCNVMSCSTIARCEMWLILW